MLATGIGLVYYFREVRVRERGTGGYSGYGRQVHEMTSSGQRPDPGRLARPDKVSHPPVRVIGLLLILQVVGLVSIGVYEVSSVDWNQVVAQQNGLQVTVETETDQAVEEAVIFIVLFLPPALLMLLSGLSFLLFKRRGWLLAAIAQGLSLGICLFIYTNPEIETADYVYPIMIYCILMILYLNSRDVRAVFGSRRDRAKRRAEAKHES